MNWAHLTIKLKFRNTLKKHQIANLFLNLNPKKPILLEYQEYNHDFFLYILSSVKY
jgi:hypothetical protein